MASFSHRKHGKGVDPPKVRTSYLPPDWRLPDGIKKRLTLKPGRQRAIADGGQLLVLLHSPPADESDERIARLFWLESPGHWIASDRCSLPSPAAPNGPSNGDDPFVCLLDEYERVIEKLDDDEEEAVRSDDYFDVLTRLSPIVRATHNLHTAILDATKIVADDPPLARANERSYELHRRVELIQHDAKLAFDFLSARHTEELAVSSKKMAEATYRLNVLVSLFLPVATLGAIFGMNLETGIETYAAPWPIVAIVASGLTIGAVIAWSITRR
ncbi:MAG: CorA family divalent cation transporter [Lacipirellulaceae bacterium]